MIIPKRSGVGGQARGERVLVHLLDTPKGQKENCPVVRIWCRGKAACLGKLG